jgi:hypothetical protein
MHFSFPALLFKRSIPVSLVLHFLHFTSLHFGYIDSINHQRCIWLINKAFLNAETERLLIKKEDEDDREKMKVFKVAEKTAIQKKKKM